MNLSRAAAPVPRQGNPATPTIACMLPELILAIAAGTFALMLTVADRVERQRSAVHVTTRNRSRLNRR